jgi:anthranilate/para-aminobenzoate synthase component II
MKVVGFITAPIINESTFGHLGRSTIPSNHVDFIKPLEWTAISFESTRTELDAFLETIHLLYIPSGNIGGSFCKKFLDCLEYCVRKIKEKNRSGIYFPIWGVCMGFQTLLAVENGMYHHNFFLEGFDSWGYKTNLPQVNRGRLTNSFSSDEIKLLELNHDKIHQHALGVSPCMFNATNIKNNYVVLHVNVDKNGKQFIGTIEHKNYPFYGFQWHPEASPNSEMFHRFFISEINKTPNKPPPENLNQGVAFDCRQYSINTYNSCYFFE